MKIKGAMVYGPGQDWQVEEFDLGDPVSGEVQVRLAASGLCHSDEHFRSGDLPAPFYPILGGHEGAGVVTKVGPGVSEVVEDDHVVLAFTPACGTCRQCARGRQNLCDRGAGIGTGKAISDDSYRATKDGAPVYQTSLTGTFAPYATVHKSSVIKIEKDIPLSRAALLGCGVCTGWGSTASIGGTQPGDTVLVIGAGGIGINAVQGAAHAGARFVVAVDPVEFKRTQALKLGATHAYATLAEATEQITEMTWGTMADVTAVTMGVLDSDLIEPALQATGKGGTVVLTAIGGRPATSVSWHHLTLHEKRVQGALFGGTSPRAQVPKLLNLYRSGMLRLDELVTRTYRLEDVNQGYEDMREGRNLRGVIEYTDADY